MSKFCANCGTEIEEGKSFCANCGAQVAEANPAAELVEKKNNKVIGLVACLAAVLVLVVVVISIFGGGSYEKVALKYATEMAELNYEKAEKYTIIKGSKIFDELVEKVAKLQDKDVSEFYEDLEEEYDVSVKGLKDIYKCARIEEEENREDIYGKYKINVEIKSTKKLSEIKTKKVVENFESGLDFVIDAEDYFNKDKVKKAYEVKIKVEIEGEDEDYTSTQSLTVVKYKGDWKVLSIGPVSEAF